MKHRILSITFLSLVTAGFLAGPGHAPLQAADKETRQMMADIRMLQEQTQQLQNLIGTLTRTLTEALDATTKQLNTRMDTKLDEQNTTNVRAFASQKASIDTMTRDVAILREKLDENNVRVGSLTQEVNALRQLVTQLNNDRTSIDPVFGPSDSAAAPRPAAVLGASPSAAWNQAFSEFSASHYELAIQGFESYIKSFPDSEKADDAQEYICRSYLNMGNNAKVIEACDATITVYPKSDKLADAYYRKGLAFKNLGRTDDARTAFQYIVNTYPGTDEANLASTQLLSPQLARKP